jgi:hypothetical protein
VAVGDDVVVGVVEDDVADTESLCASILHILLVVTGVYSPVRNRKEKAMVDMVDMSQLAVTVLQNMRYIVYPPCQQQPDGTTTTSYRSFLSENGTKQYNLAK